MKRPIVRVPILARGVAGGVFLAGCAVALLLAALALPAAAQRGARVLHRNLAELVDDAYTIVVGRVVSVHSERHPQYAGLQTVVVTLEVQETLKGQAAAQFTFRQFVTDLPDEPSQLGYRSGQELLLFLTQPSSIGLCSPAGLEQGRFRLWRDAQGNRVAVNGWNNLGLFRNIERKAPKLTEQVSGSARQLLTQHRGGPIPYDQLRDIVRTLLANQ